MELQEAYQGVIDKLEGWVYAFIEMLPNLFVALVVVAIFFLLSRLIRRGTGQVLDRTTNNQTVINLLQTIAAVMVVGVGLFIALGVLELDGTVASLLAGAGIIGLALGFAFQDIAANFMSGILLSIRHPFGIGDIIETNDYYGTVQEMNLRNTIMKTAQGKIIYIPNKMVFNNAMENYTKTKERRIDLECGVSYGDDLQKAQQVAVEAIKGLEHYNDERDVELFYTEFGGSSINFILVFWIKFRAHRDFVKTRSDAIMALKKGFDENDISIPFPITTLDFGIRGGEKLDAMLGNGNGNGNGNQPVRNGD